MLGDPEVTANIYDKSRNLPNTDTQITVQICGNFWVTCRKKSIQETRLSLVSIVLDPLFNGHQTACNVVFVNQSKVQFKENESIKIVIKIDTTL